MSYTIQSLLHTLAMIFTPAQSMKLFTAFKRSWTEHYLYLVAVSEECGEADNSVQYKIIHYADLWMRVPMLAYQNLTRVDYLRQAEELARFLQLTEMELRKKHIGKDVVNIVRNVREKAQNVRKDLRKCYSCGGRDTIGARVQRIKLTKKQVMK